MMHMQHITHYQDYTITFNNVALCQLAVCHDQQWKVVLIIGLAVVLVNMELILTILMLQLLVLQMYVGAYCACQYTCRTWWFCLLNRNH